MRQARGRILILMDGDGQNDPWDIPQLLTLLEDVNSDMAEGVRVARKDAWPRRVASRIANGVRRRILRDGVTDAGCGLKAFHRCVIEAFIPVQTLYSFIPALAVGAGFTVVEVPVRHRSRRGGKSNYGIRQFLWRPLLDLFGVWWFTRRRCPLTFPREPSRDLTCLSDGHAAPSRQADYEGAAPSE
jgi:dolichol-phosphate mannosyltransferase